MKTTVFIILVITRELRWFLRLSSVYSSFGKRRKECRTRGLSTALQKKNPDAVGRVAVSSSLVALAKSMHTSHHITVGKQNTLQVLQVWSGWGSAAALVAAAPSYPGKATPTSPQGWIEGHTKQNGNTMTPARQPRSYRGCTCSLKVQGNHSFKVDRLQTEKNPESGTITTRLRIPAGKTK